MMAVMRTMSRKICACRGEDQPKSFSPVTNVRSSHRASWEVLVQFWSSSYLGFPLHPCHRDAQQEDDCDGADDPDVVYIICHDGICALTDRTRRHQMEWPWTAEVELFDDIFGKLLLFILQIITNTDNTEQNSVLNCCRRWGHWILSLINYITYIRNSSWRHLLKSTIIGKSSCKCVTTRQWTCPLL